MFKDYSDINKTPSVTNADLVVPTLPSRSYGAQIKLIVIPLTAESRAARFTFISCIELMIMSLLNGSINTLMVKQLVQLLKYSSPVSIIHTYIWFIYVLHLITLYFLDFTVIYDDAAGRLFHAAQAGLFSILWLFVPLWSI